MPLVSGPKRGHSVRNVSVLPFSEGCPTNVADRQFRRGGRHHQIDENHALTMPLRTLDHLVKSKNASTAARGAVGAAGGSISSFGAKSGDGPSPPLTCSQGRPCALAPREAL